MTNHFKFISRAKSNRFNFKRWLQLIHTDLRLQAKTMILIVLMLAVLIAILPTRIDSGYFYILLFSGGFLMTGSAFNDLHDRSRSFTYLLLPATASEKFLARWFETTILYIFALLILLYMFSWLGVLFSWLIYKIPLSPWNIFNSDLWLTIGRYIILQSVILLGALTFKRYALIKTFFIISCFFLVLSYLMIWFMMSFYPNFIYDQFLLRASLQGWHFIFWLILAPFCWYISYLKLTEYELN